MAQEEFSDFARRLTIALSAWDKALQPALTRFTEAMKEYQPKLEEIMGQAANVLKQLPESQRHILEILAKDGWYLDLDIYLTEISKVVELYKNDNFERAREIMCQHFMSHTETFSKNLSAQFPERAEVLTAAIDAHSKGQFALSVPVFLAQADGICAQATGIELYSKSRNGLPKLAAHQDTGNLGPFLVSLLQPIIVVTPMTAGAKQRKRVDFSDALNRHAVLHGENSSYNTRLNSCRALSLLIYTAWIFKELEEFKVSQLEVRADTEI